MNNIFIIKFIFIDNLMEAPTPSGLEISEPILNSNLTTPETTMNEDKIDVNQNKTGYLSFSLPFRCFVLCLLLPPGFVYVAFPYLLSYEIIPSLFGISYVLFFYILIFYLMVFKIEINKSDSITNVNIKNIFGCNRITFNGNIHFFYKFATIEEHRQNVYFFIINDSNFDLDTENIKKKKPVRLFYLLDYSLSEVKSKSIINKFEVNNYENPLLFDIEKYTGKKFDRLVYNNYRITNLAMKFGEHFFTLYLVLSTKDQTFDCVIAIQSILYFNIPIFIYSFVQCFLNNEYILILPTLIFPIFLFLLCACYAKCRSHDSRIDFIYSKDFDRIFIGIVNYKLNGYSRTFEYKTDEIEKFLFQKSEHKNGHTKFTVLLKNETMIQIKEFKVIDAYEQEGIEYILNEKLNK